MTTRIKSPRKRTRTVKLRTNGKHKIDAASTISAPIGGLGRVLRPQALFRWLGPQLAAITPQYIEQTMIGAMAGSSIQAWALFDLMLKSWPELLACYQELIESVIRKKLVYEPYCEEDEKPTPSALEKQKVVATALRRMEPDAARDDSDLEGTIRDVLDAWFRGVAVSEVVWQTVDDKQVGTITAPKSTFAVDPTNYGFATDGSLGLRSDKSKDSSVWPYSTTTLNPAPNQLQPFPEHKFLIAIHKASGGSPLGGALLRPLAWWWCAANFSSDWLLNLAQLFGLPFRWVTYDQATSSDTLMAIDAMLQNMGSNGWARFPAGTTMEMLQTGKEGSDHSPQGELLDRADRYARSLILGQTMTGNHGTTGKGGGQAFGTVEESVKSDRIDAAGKFAVTVINQQLVPSILALNFGDTSEMPTLKFLEDEVADLTEAQRDKTLADAGLEIGVDYLRKKYDIPEPAADEETIGGAKPDPFGGGFGQQDQFGNQNDGSGNQDSESAQETRAKAISAAGDLPGHKFRGNQYSQGITEYTEDEFAAKADEFQAARKEANKIRSWPAYAQRLGEEESKARLKKFSELRNYFERVGNFHNQNYNQGRGLDSQQLTERTVDATWARKFYRAQKSIASSDQTGHPFRGNQYVTLGAHVNTPHGQGVVVATDDQSAWVSVNGQVRKYKSAEIKPVKKWDSFSILQSEENKRRLLRNQGIQTKLEALNDIKDDEIFARALKDLAGVSKDDPKPEPTSTSMSSTEHHYHPTFNVSIGETKPPEVNVAAPIVSVESAKFDIHVPETKLPDVHVDAPIVNIKAANQEPPNVTVSVSPTPVKIENNVNVDVPAVQEMEVVRGKDGKIAGIEVRRPDSEPN